MKIILSGTIDNLMTAPKGNVRMLVMTEISSFYTIVSPHVAANFLPGTRVDVEIRDGIDDNSNDLPKPLLQPEEPSLCEFCETDAHGTHAERCPISLESDLADANERIAELEAQIPADMANCTFVVRECPKGHAWLYATNWIDYGCRQCLIEALTAEIVPLKNDVVALQAIKQPHTVNIDISDQHAVSSMSRRVKQIHDGIVEC